MDLTAFKRLGTWVDLYDAMYTTTDLAPVVAEMKARGVHTLYIQTGRYNKPLDEADPGFADRASLERWVDAAHAGGLKIVGWYVPGYANVTRDVRRTTAIATFRTARGNKFDALGIDVEYKGELKDSQGKEDLAAWNAAVADQARRVRKALGSRYPIAAITPTPLGMAVLPNKWAGFPWKSLASSTNLIMLMDYWSFRDDCPEVPSHCAYGYTKGNIREVRRLTGRPSLFVHPIGGVTEPPKRVVTAQQVADFVRASREERVPGGSYYDWTTTEASFWPHLRELNRT